MENNSVTKYTTSFGLSLVLCSMVNALLVVAKEKNQRVQAEMQKLTGHHWVTHAVVVLVLFIFFGWLFTKCPALPVNRLIQMIIAGVFVAGFIIVGFYLVTG